MKKTFTFLMFALFFASITSLHAQIPSDSPFPVDFELISPAASARSFAYGSPGDGFGVILNQTVTGEVVWAYDAVDSLACDTVLVTDLVGKIALIRRGACEFGRKALNAEKAGAIGYIIVNHFNDDTQDENTVIPMGAGAVGAEVTIPGVFVSRGTGAFLDGLLQNGETVEVSYTVSYSIDPFGPTAYGIPLSQAGPMEFIEFTVFNPSDVDVVLAVDGTVDITEPNGNVVSYTTRIDTIAPSTGGTFEFEDYIPTQIGDYTITYSNSLNEDILTRTFAITDLTFQQDNGQIVANTNGTIEPSDEGFVEDGLTYHAGVFYQTGPNPGLATHVSFMISNPEELFTGDPESDQFVVLVYDTDANDDGVVDLAGGDTNLDNLTVAQFGTYTLSSENQPFDLLTVTLDEPVTLKADHQYMVMVQYNGVNAGIGIPPKYAFAGNETYIYELAEGPAAGGDIVFTDQLYTGGWAGADYNYVIRMHLDGFVGIKDLPTLEASKIQLAPNPTSVSTQLTFDLAATADEVIVRLLDISGQLISTNTYENVKNNTFNINVKDLPAGTYFLSIVTPEGYRAEKLVVGK